MNKRRWILSVVLLLVMTLLCGCQQNNAAQPVAAAPEPTAEPVTLTVTGSWPDCRAMELVAKAFGEKYPNCTVVYEYVQDYYSSLEKRMSGDEPIDLFISGNIQSDSPMLPFALDLYGQEEIDLSNTFDGLIQNYLFRGGEGDKTQLYAVPLGAEMRGLYINKTLLKSVGLDVPTNQAELMAACQTLKEHGYIAFHGNPGNFAQTLLYPWICSLIANADDPKAMHDRVNAREPGLSELLREPYQFLYTLVENGYYDYKRAQTEMDLYVDTTDEAYARYFLNIQQKDGAYAKLDDVGRVAFMPSPMSMDNVVSKTKEDYHSEIEYVFALAPIGKDGGFAYLSPAHSLAVCKNSPNLEWAIRFADFMFQPDNNKLFAEAFNVIPNTKEAFAYIHTLFDVPEERISHLGEVTFDYGFYDCVIPSMTDLSKCNNPKYMRDDGNGNLSLYPLEHYMEQAEASFQNP